MIKSSNNSSPIIGVFDSGVGGLSVFAAIRERLPHVSLVYCSDNKNFPYGPKSEAEVNSFVVKAVTRLVEKFNLDLVVVACNTASTVALDSIRAKVKTPIVGVVPAIKPAAKMSKSKVIGLLATPGTIKRKYTDLLIEEFAKDCHVVRVGSARLVEIAEAKLCGVPVDIREVQQEVEPLYENDKIDVVILGCTHFPLLLNELKATSPHTIQWIDSSEAISLRVQTLLPTNLQGKGTYRAVFTADTPALRGLKPHLIGLGFEGVGIF